MSFLLETLLVAIFALKAMATPESNIPALQAVSDGTNEFSSLFYQKTPGNLIMSPLSAAIVLAMAAYGSRGETENQFKKLLHLPSANGESGYQALIDNLNIKKLHFSISLEIELEMYSRHHIMDYNTNFY
ncbi:unnamed protein product [Xylocopa violacea]|uniref:Serpin domain-containing protein n=1 Tax=Xylocopa violacea TaxID=135666 RepID=A0ABP1NIM2_XYLVO